MKSHALPLDFELEETLNKSSKLKKIKPPSFWSQVTFLFELLWNKWWLTIWVEVEGLWTTIKLLVKSLQMLFSKCLTSCSWQCPLRHKPWSQTILMVSDYHQTSSVIPWDPAQLEYLTPTGHHLWIMLCNS